MQRVLRCYAEGNNSGWEAFCLELDIAIQADTLKDAMDDLHGAIAIHLESVMDLPEAEREHLLYRPAPLTMRLKFFWLMVRAIFAGSRRPDQGRSQGIPWFAPA